ncbi:MAG: oligoendopeptidase F [Clostridia bacterium]|nr:oligoendopeptidase F [Clostridia bacterium]
MNVVKNRNDIQDKYKWDLSALLDESTIEDRIEQVKSKITKVEEFKGKLNKDNLYDCMVIMSSIDKEIELLYTFAHMKSDLDKSVPKYLELCDIVIALYYNYRARISFFTPELIKFKIADLIECKNSIKYSNFSKEIDCIIREKKHILTEKEEKILSDVANFSQSFTDIFQAFDYVNVQLGNIHVNGEEIPLTQGLYSLSMENKDRSVREEAYNNLYKGYKDYINTLAATYIGHVKSDCIYAKTRKYKSSLEAALYNEIIPTKVYYNLLKVVGQNTKVLHKYVKYRKKELKLKEMRMFDMYLPIGNDTNEEISYDDAFDLVVKALSPLGDDYINEFKKSKEEHWIDVYETPNKRNGAYETAAYGIHPFVLLNFNGTISDAFTLAHEMGHAMHSFYSNISQCFEKAEYPIFLAEIASTVNEVLLIKYLLKTKPEYKKHYLIKYIEMFRTTLFRQTMFSEFEEFSHAEIEKGNALSFEKLNDFYGNLNKKYYGDAVVTDENICCEWARIPHFYTSFYVYKYATGITCAVNIANKILNDSSFVEKYKQFLKSGGSRYPLDTLKLVDIDLTKLDPFKVAMDDFKWAFMELNNID